MTRRDKIRNEHIRGITRVVLASNKITEKRLKWKWPFEENERGVHIAKNGRCGHNREKKKTTGQT